MDTLTLASIILTLGFASLGLLLYFRQRVRQRRAAAVDQEQPTSSDETVDAEDRAYDESFYCIMLTDGTCRPGFMMDPPKQAPDVRTPAEILPSESRLNDGLQLEERVHPGEQPRS